MSGGPDYQVKSGVTVPNGVGTSSSPQHRPRVDLHSYTRTVKTHGICPPALTAQGLTAPDVAARLAPLPTLYAS